MSIKDVRSATRLTALPALRQDNAHLPTAKERGLEDSVEVSLSPEAMAHAKAAVPPPTKEEQDANAQRILELRQQSLANLTTGPSLASDFYTDPATANDAVRFQGFFQNATVNADEMADALHRALTSPSDNGDYTTNAMDLALTQGKLKKVVETYVVAEYQDEANAFVSQFINEKAGQADQMTKVVLAQATKLAQSLGDREQARHHQDAAAQLAEGTHSSQVIRNEMLRLTASSNDSEAWFSSISSWVNENRSLPYIVEIENSHIGALQAQWQTFVSSLKTVD